jgi:hypothetical protein
MFVARDSDHKTLLYFSIKELFTVLGWRCSKSPVVSCKVDSCIPNPVLGSLVPLGLSQQIQNVSTHWLNESRSFPECFQIVTESRSLRMLIPACPLLLGTFSSAESKWCSTLYVLIYNLDPKFLNIS